MGLSGLEPPTSRLSGVRSNRLSYKPTKSGSHLLFHTVSSIVPSAAYVFTVVFGMGTGVARKRIATGNSLSPLRYRLRSAFTTSLRPSGLELRMPVAGVARLALRFAFQLAFRRAAASATKRYNPTLTASLRKEVIQPLVLERLPCYDFTPVTGPAFGSSFLAVRSLTSGVTDSHGVTGGVYKTRERIHRDMLIRDY